MQVCLLKGHKLHYLYCVFLLKDPFKLVLNCSYVAGIEFLWSFSWTLGHRPVNHFIRQEAREVLSSKQWDGWSETIMCITKATEILACDQKDDPKGK